MSRKRPLYLHKTITRHQKVAWYFWRRPGPKIRIHGEYGSKAFMEAYRAALLGKERPKEATHHPESLSATILAYRRSAAWASLAATSKRQRDNVLDRVERKIGTMPAREISRAMIASTRDSLTPGAAHHFVYTMRALFKWAMENGYVDDNPAQGVKVSQPKTDGFETWSEGDIEAYRGRWAIGTRQRLWLEILLNTGLRREDAARLARGHIREGLVEIAASKTGTPVILPLHQELRAVLDASPLGQDSFIGMSNDAFGRAFKKACDEAGVSGRAHGLRKAAAARLAEAGASVPELNSVFGWTGAKMALRYTQKADRARLARQAIERAAMFSPSKGKNI